MFKESSITKEYVVIVDFGSQYTHLISRRIRELGVYSEIVSPNKVLELIKMQRPKAIILSGGPRSVYEDSAPTIDSKVLELEIPILGICYGHQLLAKLIGGEIRKSKGEYGKTILEIMITNTIFEGLSKKETVWMSHRDQVISIPNTAIILASTDITPIAAFKLRNKAIYGVQFHPEVRHTPKGMKILSNFLFKIARCKPLWRPEALIPKLVQEIRSKVKSTEKALCAVSGGVDSTTAAVLAKKALGNRLITVFINHGLLREGEAEEVLNTLRNTLGLNTIYIDASKEFLEKLKGVKDPEEKRRIIGEEFAKIFLDIASRIDNLKWLIQGTTYPDVIESGSGSSGSSRIKTHHNVAGLPKWLRLKVIEPLRYFYKDEVRRIARELGIPDSIVKRHPFPGPGLAVRIIGEVNEEKLRIVRKASAIIEEEIKNAGLYENIWQAFAVIGDDKWVGVKGDEREEGYIVTIRIVESEDGMTADWVRIPYEILEKISARIISEIQEVVMVTYAITPKPPSTIEPC